MTLLQTLLYYARHCKKRLLGTFHSESQRKTAYQGLLGSIGVCVGIVGWLLPGVAHRFRRFLYIYMSA